MKKYILFLAVAGLMSSCYDLDQYPHDKLNSGTFWKTETHAHQGMMSIYASLKNENVFGGYWACDGASDIAWDDTWMYGVNVGTYTDRGGIIEGKWQGLYECVARANLLLQNIDNVEMAEDLKLQYKGEAKFLRALCYFELLDFYGGVPLYDEKTIVSNSSFGFRF